MTTCNTCRQPIQPGEMSHVIQGTPDESWTEHVLAHDCVAATARRCAEIAEGDVDQYHHEAYLRGRNSMATDIRREFPAAFVTPEGK